MKRIIVFIFLCFCVFANAQTNIRNVDAATFKTLISENKYELIDLRTTEEINSKGKIKGARQIDFFGKNAEKEIDALDRNKPYLIYCAGGGRSSECADLMKQKGFKEVVNLEKGFDDWKKKGFETEKK